MAGPKRRPATPETDTPLSLDELGVRIHAKGRHLRERVAASPTLRAGRRYVGRRVFFIESCVVHYIHHEMPTVPQRASRPARAPPVPPVTPREEA